MKIRILLCLLLLFTIFIPFNAFSQEWQPFRNGEEYHYTGYSFHRVDSVSLSGADSVFHFAKRIDSTGIFYWLCTAPDLPRQFGFTITKEASGNIIFVTADSLPVTIKPNAVLNDTWSFYTLPNGNNVIATFTSWSNFTLGAFTDSVKVFTLQVQDINGVPILHPANGVEIHLSKTLGFVRVLPLYFLSDAMDWNSPMVLKGFEGAMSLGEPNHGADFFYDFQVGDVFHIREGALLPAGPGAHHSYTNSLLEITSLNISGAGITIHYSGVREHFELVYYPYSCTRSVTTGPFTENHTFWGSVLNDFPELNPADTIDVHTASWYDSTGRFNYNGRLAKSQLEFAYTNLTDSSCWFLNFIGSGELLEEKSSNYVAGLGGPYYHREDQAYIMYRELVYFKKGAETWGTPLIVSTEDKIEDDALQVFPNPVENEIQFTLMTNRHGSFIAKVYDVLGVELFTSSKFDSQEGKESFSLPAENLVPGFYFLELRMDDGRVVTKRIAKQ